MVDTKISALTQVSAVVDGDEFAVNDVGTSKKVTAVQLRAYAEIQPYATGSLTVPDGSYIVTSNHVILTGSQRITLQGTARWRHT